MKKAIYTLILLLATLFLSCGNAADNKHTAIENAVRRMSHQYPAATLRDMYKSFFQDYFGVAHMLAERDKVKGYIEYELATADTLDAAYYEPCGWRGNFVRVNLAAVRDGHISIDELTDAFMASVAYSRNEVTHEWLCEWESIMRAIRVVSGDMIAFREDSTALATMLAAGKYVVHHSETYSRLYHPHYRIVHKSIFEERILPHLPQ